MYVRTSVWVRGADGVTGRWRLDLFGEDEGVDIYRQIPCERFTCSKQLTEFFEHSNSFSLKIFHINIRCYYKNIDEVLIVLDSLQTCFDIIVLTEAWIDEDRALISLDNYDVFCTSDNWNRNDGVVVYVRTRLDCVSKQTRIGEATGLQLDFDLDNRHFCVLAIYRSPNMNCDLFLNELQGYYSKLINKNSYILIGDINIDTLLIDKDSAQTDYYLDILYGAGFSQCINLPTRVTDHSQSCIDHLFIKHFNYKAVCSGVLEIEATDHYAIIGKIELSTPPTTEGPNGSLTYIDTEVLSGLVGAQAWDHVLAQQDVNDGCQAFINTFNNLKSLSERTLKKSTRFKKLKPWITSDLIREIRKRDKMSKSVKNQQSNQQLLNEYRVFRRELSNRIKNTKTIYYRNEILNSAKNPKKFWKTINEYSGVNSKGRNDFPLKHFWTSAGGTRGVANDFNKFFSQVGRKLADELPPPTVPPLVDDADHRAGHEFCLEPVTEEQLVQCITEMRGGSAPGHDKISTKFLKNNFTHFLTPLKHIINLSLISGVFPDHCKLAKVIPIFKSSCKTNMSNYRPISLLSVVSKVLEKCVKVQLQNYLEENQLLSEHQFGFRRNKNTSDALFAINKSIMDCVNKNEKVLTVFIDLAKAFDSIDRNALFAKLECIGIRGQALKWFKSYLSHRSQIVAINDAFSVPEIVDYGVVQGSTLGPVLFLIYINNLDKVNITGELFLFADDTAVVFKGKSWADVYESAKKDLCLLKTWFTDNVLTMNINKTKCMPIALRPVSEPPADLELVLHSCGELNSDTCNCQIVEKVTQYKYLGVIFDSKLKFVSHIAYLKMKLRKMIYVFFQLSNILNENEIKTVYFAYVQSCLSYGIIAWGGVFRTILQPLILIQKRIIKAGLKKPLRYPSALLFKDSKLLTVRQLYIKSILVYAFSRKELVLTPIGHKYQTRNALNVGVNVPRVVKTINTISPVFTANILYRNIPQELRDWQGEVRRFKKLVTDWLLVVGPDDAERLLASVYNPRT